MYIYNETYRLWLSVDLLFDFGSVPNALKILVTNVLSIQLYSEVNTCHKTFIKLP